jgi:hypothetical protein
MRYLLSPLRKGEISLNDVERFLADPASKSLQFALLDAKAESVHQKDSWWSDQ